MNHPLTPETLAELPAELREQLKTGSRAGPSAASLVLEAITVKNEVTGSPLDLNEILISVWNRHKVVLRRSTAAVAITSLRRDGLVRRCGRGTFALGKEDMPVVVPRQPAAKKKVAKKKVAKKAA